jgi:hypothetical protein
MSILLLDDYIINTERSGDIYDIGHARFRQGRKNHRAVGFSNFACKSFQILLRQNLSAERTQIVERMF